MSERLYSGIALDLHGIVFPRGFAALEDGTFIVASGTDPRTGDGRTALLHYKNRASGPRAFVEDPLLDPLDMAVRDGHVYVTSEYPFGSDNAFASLRCYDLHTATLQTVWSKETASAFINF